MPEQSLDALMERLNEAAMPEIAAALWRLLTGADE